MDALKFNNMEEKIHLIKTAFYIRLLNNQHIREVMKVLIKLYNGVLHSSSILIYALVQMDCQTELNKYLMIYRLKEYATLKLQNTCQRINNRFKRDDPAITIRGMLWNLAENRNLIQEMLEHMGTDFLRRRT